jgi:hypothetical protein
VVVTMMSTINYDARATLHKWQSLERKRASDPPTFGITRGTHVLKALSVGAKACSGGRFYLYALAAAGQPGVERALGNLRAEIERDMKLMGCRSVDQLSRDNLRLR